ncbi:MAG TPA: hypothetical protein PLN42_00355 [Anaerolineae bacterium]|nr:hypothetical protein [Anaerolineae bacterium]
MSRRRAAHEALRRLYCAQDLDTLTYLEDLAEELEMARRFSVMFQLLIARLPPGQRWAARKFIIAAILDGRIIE